MATIEPNPNDPPTLGARLISDEWTENERLIVIALLSKNGNEIVRNSGRIDGSTAYQLFETISFVAGMSAQFLATNRKQILKGLEGVK